MPPYSTTLGQKHFTFADLRELMAKATPMRSGDALAGISAANEKERAAAQRVLADVPLEQFLEELLIPYEQDEVTRLIVDEHDAAAFAPLKEMTVGEFREWRPEFVLTHSELDPYNPDHPTAHAITVQTRVYAQALGYPAPGTPLGAPPVFMFEPHQPEQCEFQPQVLLDVTPVWKTKHQAMESMEAQKHLWEYYTDLGKRRGVQAVRNSGRSDIQYAEAYQRVYPQVTDVLA